MITILLKIDRTVGSYINIIQIEIHTEYLWQVVTSKCHQKPSLKILRGGV